MTSPLLNQFAPDFTREAHNGPQVRLAAVDLKLADEEIQQLEKPY